MEIAPNSSFVSRMLTALCCILGLAATGRASADEMRLILAGQADLGVTQLSEVVQANRAALVGPFPREHDLATTYALWYRSDVAPAAKAFAELVTGPAGRAKLTQHGLRASQD